MRIAIVGAGPSGLAVAKALRDAGLSPVIFEASASLGGVWAPSNHRLWKSLHTNLSKYTCCFADFPWIQHDATSSTPLFPSSQQVHDYLQKYAEQFIPSTSFRFNHKVTQLQSLQNGKYLLSWKSPILEESAEFEKVVIASGFFSSSSNTNSSNDSQAFEGSEYFQGKVYYSSDYVDPAPFHGKQVMVVGGSFSGCEIAAEISSTAKKVFHVLPTHTYVIPRYLPLHPQSPATPFLPLDLVFYCLPKDKLEKLTNDADTSSFEVLFKTKSEAYKTKAYLQALVGDSSYTDPLYALHNKGNEEEDVRQASVAITDRYKAMVRSGAVEVIPGRLTKCTSDGRLVVQPADNISTTVETLSEKLSSITDIVVCTGFQPNVGDYMETSLLKDVLQYLPQDHHSPLQLFRELFHPQLPGLHFVGMYKGPYFGVIELQAKLTAKYISGELPWPSEAELEAGLDTARSIRSHLPRPQFPHSDYMGLMLDLAKTMKLKPQLPEQFPVLLPTSFSVSNANEANEAVLRELELFRQGKHVAKAVAYALEGGKWSLYRELLDHDSGKINIVEGHVQFHRIASDAGLGQVQSVGKCGVDATGSCGTADTPTLPSSLTSSELFQHPFLWYHEEGQMKLSNGMKFDVSQSYIYRYNEESDTLDLFFSKVGHPQEIDRPFLRLRFSPVENEGWLAKAYHLCGEDHYHASYLMSFAGLNIAKMEVTFEVRGPKKNYRSTTVFTACH